MSSISENLVVHNFSTMENSSFLNVENRLKPRQLDITDGFQANADHHQAVRLNAIQGRVDSPSIDAEHHEGHEVHHSRCDSQQVCLNDENGNSKPVTASSKFYHSVDDTENDPPSSNWDEESPSPEAAWLEQDEPVALWVKWGGKWQAGIRCVREDCPLPTLKARPTHDRKKYFVVFFPHSRNYSWVDMLLVRPIDEFPEPIAHKTHSQGLEMVEDMTLPSRFIMQRLAVGMLDVSDQLHTEAVIEAARKVTSWKEFAMEASQCKGYSDLGRMLPKLKSMILQRYIDPDWLQNSFESWAQHCQNAESAESVEVLKEELVSSILWNEIEGLWDGPVQPELGSEWKTWKQEVMKWFSTSHPTATVRDMEHYDGDDSSTVGPQISRKRPKLEIRRAEMHGLQVEAGVSHEIQPQVDTTLIDSGFFDRAGLENANTLGSESCKDKSLPDTSVQSENPGNMSEKSLVETSNDKVLPTTVVDNKSEAAGNVGNPLDAGNKFRQCLAFIEAKGRQCIRWASDGDDYCCVHLAIRDKSPKAELSSLSDTPMCAGTTTLGTKCKHRSQYGSTFCKKHRLQPSQYLMDSEKPSNVAPNTLKRSHSEMICRTESATCQETTLTGEVENPVQDASQCAMEGEPLDRRSILVENSDLSVNGRHSVESLRCIGSSHPHNNDPCSDHAKLHTLYCEKHIPAFLKRARNGKSRIISKEVFVEFLRKCVSQEQKLHLHKACVLLHGFVKGVLSQRNPISKESQLQWILSEASKDLCIGECLFKLVSYEREKLKRLWSFDLNIDKLVPSSVTESVLQPESLQKDCITQTTVKCKICSKEFADDESLGSHWMDIHKKEARWLFRGYACAICLNSFANKKILEIHGREKHQVQFLEQCLLLKCVPCGSHFVDSEQLWLHVLSLHSNDFKMCTVAPQHDLSATQASKQLVPGIEDTSEKNRIIQNGVRRFICKFCGLKFDILPDLGRHHQAVHMGLNPLSHISNRRGTHLDPYKSKSGRLSRPSYMKGLGAASYRIRNRGNMRLKKCFQASSSATTGEETMQIQVAEVVGLGRLAESQCLAVAKSLFAEIEKAKPRPSNLDILSVARSTCCKIRLQAELTEQFGVLPERLYLKAAKLCSELNFQVEWHQEGFICPKGCKPVTDSRASSPLMPLPRSIEQTPNDSKDLMDTGEWEIDECHYIIESRHIQSELLKKAIVLCEDTSFGLESVAVNCVVDEDLVSSLRTALAEGSSSKIAVCPMPWDSFTYVTERLLDASIHHDTESSQLGCACPHSSCSPDACDHVYLFDNDYEDAKDIHGQPMQGRFPYDYQRKIILEEGYLVYECNSSCSCDKTCPNRVLQNGIQVQLEIFKSEKKGWAVRAREAISRGTFVCEYIGEVLIVEANKGDCSKQGCSYVYKIDDTSGLSEGLDSHVIDATRYGNVSRFINHSCSPNLACYQVLVESMDCQLAHIGFYASRDIAAGEELAYSYREKLIVSTEQACYCNSPNCQGRI